MKKPFNKKYNRETVGSLSLEAQNKPLETTDCREQGKEMTKGYIDQLILTLEDAKKTLKDDFFIVVLTKKEPLMQNVIRNYFFYRSSCPTPDYDQAVYHYVKANDELNFLWIIPSKSFCIHLVENALTIDKEFKELLSFVLDFKDETLYKLSKKLNNEGVLEGGVVLKILDDNEKEINGNK